MQPISPIRSIRSIRSLRVIALIALAPLTAPASNAPSVRGTLDALSQYAEANAHASQLYQAVFLDLPEARAMFRGREQAFREMAEYIQSLSLATLPRTEPTATARAVSVSDR